MAIRDTGGLGEFERLILQQAVTIVALELMRRRVVRDTERRLAGDILAEVVAGELDEAGAARPAAPVRRRVQRRRAGLRAAATPRPPRPRSRRRSSRPAAPRLVASREGLLCAVVDGSVEDPVALAAQARDGARARARAGPRRGQPRRRRRRT